MSALGTLASTAVAGVWKIAAVVLLALLLMIIAVGGVGWWTLSSARDEALSDLSAERDKNADLIVSITRQNDAVTVLAEQKTKAEARGIVAHALAAANGKRYDKAMNQMQAVKATTCGEAMPAVNAVLGAIQ